MQVREKDRAHQIITLSLIDYSATLHKPISVNKHISAYTLLVDKETYINKLFQEESVNKEQILQDFMRNATQEDQVFFIHHRKCKTSRTHSLLKHPT